MLLKSRLTVLLIIALLVITVLPASAMLYGQASVQAAPAEEMIKLADRAAQQVKNLIDLVQVNETALQAIESDRKRGINITEPFTSSHPTTNTHHKTKHL